MNLFNITVTGYDSDNDQLDCYFVFTTPDIKDLVKYFTFYYHHRDSLAAPIHNVVERLIRDQSKNIYMNIEACIDGSFRELTIEDFADIEIDTLETFSSITGTLEGEISVKL